MSDTIRWGILGTGHIARQVADAICQTEGAMLWAVGSRHQSTADAFANIFAIPKRYATYAALVADPQVDIVYISTPHTLHYENTILCLRHGKAVLCEKPLAMTPWQAQTMADLAHETGLFLAEAMWTRFLPLFGRIHQMCEDGLLGRIRRVEADFGFCAPYDPQSRLFDPNLGGGALFDIGIYPVTLAAMLMGHPHTLHVMGYVGRTNVDETVSGLLVYDEGRTLSFDCTLLYDTPTQATIIGTEGAIRVPYRWFTQDHAFWQRGNVIERIQATTYTNGYRHEIEAVQSSLRHGLLGCPEMPLAESVRTIHTLSEILSKVRGNVA
jgi:predicted dehydrogenase